MIFQWFIRKFKIMLLFYAYRSLNFLIYNFQGVAQFICQKNGGFLFKVLSSMLEVPPHIFLSFKYVQYVQPPIDFIRICILMSNNNSVRIIIISRGFSLKKSIHYRLNRRVSTWLWFISRNKNYNDNISTT